MISLRALPCDHCPSARRGGERPPAKLPDGHAYVLARWPGGRLLRYKCAACKRKTAVTLMDWHNLSRLTEEQAKELLSPAMLKSYQQLTLSEATG